MIAGQPGLLAAVETSVLCWHTHCVRAHACRMRPAAAYATGCLLPCCKEELLAVAAVNRCVLSLVPAHLNILQPECVVDVFCGELCALCMLSKLQRLLRVHNMQRHSKRLRLHAGTISTPHLHMLLQQLCCRLQIALSRTESQKPRAATCGLSCG